MAKKEQSAAKSARKNAKKLVKKPVTAKHEMGRPDKLTPEIQDRIVQYIRVGAFVETAASAAGISKVTLYDWMRRGSRQKHGKFKDFLNAIEQAFSEATIADLARISSATDKDWRAAAYRLEKRERRLYGQHVQISGPGGGPIEVEQSWNLQNLSKEELESLEKILLKTGCGSGERSGLGEAGAEAQE